MEEILEDARRRRAPPRTDGWCPGGRSPSASPGDDEEVTFLLGAREESGSPIDVYSPKSRLGAAIMDGKDGKKATLLPCPTAGPAQST